MQTSVVADRVRITVTDSGAGVPEEARPMLFEPFFTTKPVGKGTGLRLAISYQIVQSNGGELYLDATWKEGARFVVELPIKAEARRAHAA